MLKFRRKAQLGQCWSFFVSLRLRLSSSVSWTLSNFEIEVLSLGWGWCSIVKSRLIESIWVLVRGGEDSIVRFRFSEGDVEVSMKLGAVEFNLTYWGWSWVILRLMFRREVERGRSSSPIMKLNLKFYSEAEVKVISWVEAAWGRGSFIVSWGWLLKHIMHNLV